MSADEKWVLIVDDVETNRFVLRNIIVDMGHKPILAASGVQALKIIEHQKPNIILMDIAMPEMDGYELTQKIKENPDTREIPIIFISAFDNIDDITKGFNIGGEDYITKPFIQEVVKARVGAHLKLADSQQDLQGMNQRLVVSVNEQIKELEEEKKNVLLILAKIAKSNASYSDNHLDRVQYNSKVLAQAMQLSTEFESVISDQFIETIELASPLCDLGNIAIPLDILQKKSSLSDEEKEIMKTHTLRGAGFLDDVVGKNISNTYLIMAEDIIKYHHENYDGSGYPENLKGDQIPLSAQIVSLVNAYCALTEERTFRAKYSPDDAIKTLSSDAGVMFNSKIFDICKVIYKQFI